MTIKTTLIALLIFSAFKSNAQQEQVAESEMPMSLGTRPGYTIKVTNIEVKTATKLWNDFVKNEFSSRLKSVKGFDESVALESKLKSLSKEAFNLHSTLKASGSDVIVSVWFDMGSTFLSSTTDKSGSESAKAKLVDFSYYVQKVNSQEILAGENEKLKDAEKALSRLISDGESINKDIRNYEDKIENLKRDREKNLNEQTNAQKSLDEQKQKVKDSQKATDAIGK